MRSGLPVTAQLIYPIYSDNHIVLPENTLLHGTVVSLRPDTSRRIRARLGGDFTPFHIPVVRFSEFVLPDGVHIPIDTATSTDGAPIFRAVAPPAPKGGFLRQQLDSGVAAVRSDVAIFTAPGKGDRLTQFVYNRLPYHPQRIEKATAWTTETTASIDLPAQPAPPPPAPVDPPRSRRFWEEPPAAPSPPDNDSGRWMIHAFLDQPLSSETSKAGQPIKATVASPILNPDGSIAVPQGATLVGTIAKAQPARRFGRTGVLSFNFRQLTIPGGEVQNVETTLAGADSAAGLALNSEGQVKSKPQDKISVPIILALLASRPLDGDRGRQENPGWQKRRWRRRRSWPGRNHHRSFRCIAQRRRWHRLLWHRNRRLLPLGRPRQKKNLVFPRDTRIVVQTVARRSAAIHPDPERTRNR